MIIFIIPLKSKRVSRNWTRVCQLIERCLYSVVNQTSEQFRAVIVCHEKPDISIQHPAVHYVQVEFPPPQLGQTNVISQMDRDKNQKMWAGLDYARQFNPTHVMFVDADDCVSCKIAEFVSQYPNSNGWFLDSGYIYEDGSDRIYFKHRNFYMMSGTSHIIRYSLIQNKDLVTLYTDSEEPLHQLIVTLLANQQSPLQPLPFAGAVYIIETGENINADKGADRSGREDILSFIRNMTLNYPRKIRTLLGSEQLSESLINEFNLSNFNVKAFN